jgi:hypothetical protein
MTLSISISQSPLEQPPGALNTDPESFQPVFAELGKWFVLISSEPVPRSRFTARERGSLKSGGSDRPLFGVPYCSPMPEQVLVSAVAISSGLGPNEQAASNSMTATAVISFAWVLIGSLGSHGSRYRAKPSPLPKTRQRLNTSANRLAQSQR